MKIDAEQLKSFLIDFDLVTEKQFEEIEKKSEKNNQKIEDVLISEEIVKEEVIAKIKAYILKIPFIDIENRKLDPEILKIIPERIARTNNIIAFRKTGKNLETAMTNPEDLRIIEIVKKATGLNVLPRLATFQGIKKALSQYGESLEVEFDEIVKDDQDRIKLVKERGYKEDNLESVAKELPVIKIVDILIRHAILQRASDIHIEPQEKEIIIRYRIDGILRDAMILPINIAPGIVARIKILSNLKLDEHRLPQDGRFRIETDDYRYSLRVSVLPVSYGEKIVMRLLSETAEAMNLEEIGFLGESLEKVEESLKKLSGMILITGPTGSGKTTTLYSLLDILNTSKINISTIEDPIEYQISRINQTQVKPKIGLTFASGLRSLVRQDPDVIMVGEIRDNETAQLAINAALTGHLVLSTLHTTNSAGAVSRLIDMKVEQFLISSTLNIVIAQRLLRRLHQEKKPYFLSDVEIENIKKYCDMDRLLILMKKHKIIKPGQSFKKIKFYRPQGTKEVPDGYKGRIGIYEVLLVTESIRELIIEKTSSSKIEEEAKKEGMITMFEDGIIKAAQGITSIEEVLRVLIE